MHRVFGLCVWLMLFPLPEMLCFLNVHKLFFPGAFSSSHFPTSRCCHLPLPQVLTVVCCSLWHSLLCRRILMIWVLVSLLLYFPSCLTQCLEHVQWFIEIFNRGGGSSQQFQLQNFKYLIKAFSQKKKQQVKFLLHFQEFVVLAPITTTSLSL